MSGSTRQDRVVLGTVQLGLPYGRNVEGPLMPELSARAILDAAWERGIRAFDTAEAYGEAASRLARWLHASGHDEAEIVTKARVDDPALRESRLRAATDCFRDNGKLLLLSHNAASGEPWRDLVLAARSAEARFGQSVYDPAEVEIAVSLPGVTRVQAPGNVLDERALRARAATGAVVPLDLRSVYLQGVLLENEETADRRAPGSAKLVRTVGRSAASVGLPVPVALVAAALAMLSEGDRIVIGVDMPTELDAVLAAMCVSRTTAIEFHSLVLAGCPRGAVASVLDPRRWKAKS